MKLSELDEKIKTTTTATLEEQKEALIESAKTAARDVFKDEIAGQLREQLDDGIAKIKAQMPAPTKEIIQAEEDAKKFKGGAEFLKSVFTARYTRGAQVDSRLSFVTGKGEVKKGKQIPADFKSKEELLAAAEQKTTGHFEVGDDSLGGFLVPEEFRREIYQIGLENAVVRPNGPTVIPMTTDSIKIPFIDDSTHASNVFGGCLSYWAGEAKQFTASAALFGQQELTPHKLIGLTYASDEIMADSFVALEALIKTQFGRTSGYYEDDAFLNGSGAGRPLGIKNGGCVKSVKRNTVTQIELEDLAEMQSYLLPGSWGSAVWVANPSIIPHLIQLGSGNAANASGRNLVFITTVQDKPVWQIFGRPVIFSEKMSQLGTAADLALYDMRYYIIGDRQPLTIDVSPHLKFDYGEIAWRYYLRVAGQPWPSSTLTLKAGTHVYAPFITLAADTS